MEKIAIKILENYIKARIAKNAEFKIYIVWQCKALQNYKFLLISDLPDNEYYELTYNGDKKEWYLDRYTKVDNIVVLVG